MRRLTWKELNEQYGGVLPPGAVLRPDDDEAATPARASAPSEKPRRRTRSERFADMNAFVDMVLASLTGAETKVWLILFRDTKSNGTARTGQADIARRAGLKPRMVRYALVSLQNKGLISLVRRGRLNAGPSTYRVHPTGTA